MCEQNKPGSGSSSSTNPAVEAMLQMQKELSDVRGTEGLETEAAVMRTVKELRTEKSNI